MTGKETIAGYIAQAAKLLRAEFEHIRTTNPHAGEGGKEIENIVKEFLNHHMPQRFRATAGFVIDKFSEMSGHEDVLIYDEPPESREESWPPSTRVLNSLATIASTSPNWRSGRP